MTDLKALERSYYEAFNARQFDRYGEFFEDDVEVLAPGGFTARGIEAMRAFDRGWVTGFPDAVIALETQAGDERAVSSENTFTGTHTGVLSSAGGDIPSTGRRIERAQYAVTLEARNGKFNSFHCYYDQMELLTLLGLGPAK